MPGTWILAILPNGRPYPCRGTIVPVPTKGFEAATGFRRIDPRPRGQHHTANMMLGHCHYAYAMRQKHTLQ